MIKNPFSWIDTAKKVFSNNVNSNNSENSDSNNPDSMTHTFSERLKILNEAIKEIDDAIEKRRELNRDFNEQIEAERRQAYFDSQPAICQKCRWLDYEFGCNQTAYPINDKCYLFANRKFLKPLWLWDWLWGVRVWICENVLHKRRNKHLWIPFGRLGHFEVDYYDE